MVISPTPQRNESDVAFEGTPAYSPYVLENDNPRVIYQAFKRATDIVLALIGLVVLSPLFLIVAILIKLEDPKGSVFWTNPCR